jgi:hypothetical protein
MGRPRPAPLTGGPPAALKEKGRAASSALSFFVIHQFEFPEMAELIAQRRCAHSLGVDRAAK